MNKFEALAIVIVTNKYIIGLGRYYLNKILFG